MNNKKPVADQYNPCYLESMTSKPARLPAVRVQVLWICIVMLLMALGIIALIIHENLL
jgi:hypothetical protein